MRAPARRCEAAMGLDVILGGAAALFLLVYMTYALIWPEKF